MSLDHAQLVGSFVILALALLSGYLLLLRLREAFQEKPDPKTTYATLVELDKLRAQIFQHQRDTKADFAAVHALIYKNAEHLARVIATSESANQRLHELAIKTDKLVAKYGPPQA